jgi:transposase-like protein
VHDVNGNTLDLEAYPGATHVAVWKCRATASAGETTDVLVNPRGDHLASVEFLHRSANSVSQCG